MFSGKFIKHKKMSIMTFVALLGYICLSCFAGYPIGLGNAFARSYTKNYCKTVYPAAEFGKTKYSIFSSSFYTSVFADGKTFDIWTSPNSATVSDEKRRDTLFEELEINEIVSRLNQRFFSGMNHSYVYCNMVWLHEDPFAPVAIMDIAYSDRYSETLPTETEMKKILFPVVSACYEDLNAIVTINRINISYYHPDFDPQEAGMTWQKMQINLEADTSFNTEMLFNAEVAAK